MPFARASSDELAAVRNVLQDPLSGRKVMIPFTSKAFIEGSLQPSMAENEEQVIVKLSEKELVEMSRTEAQKLLEKRMDVLKKEKVKTFISKPSKKGSKLPAESAPSMPYFEIREEYDQEGNEIRAEAINVAKELEYLQRKEDEKLDSAVRVASSQDAESLEQEQNPKRDESHRNVSNEEYEKISDRLEKLARLEEETEAKKKLNKASSRKLQGSGWGKGFLNKKKKNPVRNEIFTSTDEVSKEKEMQQQSAKKVNFAENYKNPDMRSSPSNSSTTVHARRPIASNVFSGVIKEHVVGEQSKPKQLTGESAKKPLSLFAQRRLAQQH